LGPRARVPAAAAVVVIPVRVNTPAAAAGLGICVGSGPWLVAFLGAAAAVPFIGLVTADGNAGTIAAGLSRAARVPAGPAVVVIVLVVHAPAAAADVVLPAPGICCAAVLLIGQGVKASAFHAGIGGLAEVVARAAVIQVAGGVRADAVAALRPFAAPDVASPAVVIIGPEIDTPGTALRGTVGAGADPKRAGCVCPALRSACMAVVRIGVRIRAPAAAAGLENAAPVPAPPAVPVVMQV